MHKCPPFQILQIHVTLQLWDITNRQYSNIKTVPVTCSLRLRHRMITLAHAMIPAEGTDDVGGALCGEGGMSAAVTSAISCTQTHTHTHRHTDTHTQTHTHTDTHRHTHTNTHTYKGKEGRNGT